MSMSGFQVSNSIHDMVQCPYDANHQVGRSRMLRHFYECREKHPELAPKVTICQYNSSHHVPNEVYALHLQICESYKLHLYQNANSLAPRK